MNRIVVVVDSREQEPYGIDPGCATTVVKALPAGDYSVEGLEEVVAVERKSLEDYVKTVTRARERFTRELRRLALCRAACVVVEGSMAEVLAGDYRSHAHPNSVLGATLSILLDHGVPVVFAGDRPTACRFTQDYLMRCARRLEVRCPS